MAPFRAATSDCRSPLAYWTQIKKRGRKTSGWPPGNRAAGTVPPEEDLSAGHPAVREDGSRLALRQRG